MVDLHTHSVLSDGSYKVEELIEEAKQRGVTALAVTDHDDLRSVDYIKKHHLATDIIMLPGIEMSTETHYLGSKNKIHLLGYGFDNNDPQLNLTLNELYKRRRQDNWNFIKELINRYSFLDEKSFETLDCSKYGWIKKLILMHLKDAITKEQYYELASYLDKNKPVYHNYNTGVEEAIRLIHNAGGYAIIAHPYRTYLEEEQLDNLIRYLVTKHGLDGLETHHSEASTKDMKIATYLAEKYHLMKTTGSDFHHHDEYNIEIGTGINNNIITEELPLVKKLVKENKNIK